MANAVCFNGVHPITGPSKSASSTYVVIPKSNFSPQRSSIISVSPFPSFRCVQPLRAQDSDNKKTTKTISIVCAECNGNGAKVCTQCEGNGVNSKDHFDGKFKAGGLCWLCRGKRDILCGNCNGAGFMGGFMNALED